jgi:hypothetical protein
LLLPFLPLLLPLLPLQLVLVLALVLGGLLVALLRCE